MAETVLISGGTVAAVPAVLFLIAFGLSAGTKISPVLLTVLMAAAGAVLCS
jgi:threonine/homoserine/homoserine lactone efflux protein